MSNEIPLPHPDVDSKATELREASSYVDGQITSNQHSIGSSSSTLEGIQNKLAGLRPSQEKGRKADGLRSERDFLLGQIAMYQKDLRGATAAKPVIDAAVSAHYQANKDAYAENAITIARADGYEPNLQPGQPIEHAKNVIPDENW